MPWQQHGRAARVHACNPVMAVASPGSIYLRLLQNIHRCDCIFYHAHHCNTMLAWHLHSLGRILGAEWEQCTCTCNKPWHALAAAWANSTCVCVKPCPGSSMARQHTFALFADDSHVRVHILPCTPPRHHVHMTSTEFMQNHRSRIGAMHIHAQTTLPYPGSSMRGQHMCMRATLP